LRTDLSMRWLPSFVILMKKCFCKSQLARHVSGKTLKVKRLETMKSKGQNMKAEICWGHICL